MPDEEQENHRSGPIRDTEDATPDAYEGNQPEKQRPSISEQAFVDRIRKSDRWMIGLTGAIAVGGLISAVIFGYQLREMQVTSLLTRESIRISKDALGLTQRPWLSIEMSILGPLDFNPAGADIEIGVAIKNHGHSPAMNVRNFVILDPDSAGDKGPKFCELQRARIATNFAQVIFPDDTVLDEHIAHADIGEIKAVTQRRDTIAPLLTACVDYVSKYDSERHQTVVTVNLLKNPKADGQIFAIKINSGSILKSDLHLEHVFGAFRAD